MSSTSGMKAARRVRPVLCAAADSAGWRVPRAPFTDFDDMLAVRYFSHRPVTILQHAESRLRGDRRWAKGANIYLRRPGRSGISTVNCQLLTAPRHSVTCPLQRGTSLPRAV